ncbi:MAG: hypothetical protein NTV49_00640, partial [Kiritimatiellaeota bacterium]|nr:hypothetical protein [Kiritimatiellota bacterium]
TPTAASWPRRKAYGRDKPWSFRERRALQFVIERRAADAYNFAQVRIAAGREENYGQYGFF